MVKVITNNGTVFEVKNSGDKVFINNEEISADIVPMGTDAFHLIHDNRTFTVTMVAHDHEAKTCTLLVNGKRIEYHLKDEYDALLEKLGLSGGAAKKLNELKAPMPGLVLRTLVNEGDSIKKGDGLLVLEAMKMENILKSTGDGIVKKLHVHEKDKVEKGQLLISF